MGTLPVSPDTFARLLRILVIVFTSGAFLALIVTETERAVCAGTSGGESDTSVKKTISPEQDFDVSSLKASRGRAAIFTEKGFDNRRLSEPEYAAGKPGLNRDFATPREIVLSRLMMGAVPVDSPIEKGFDSSPVIRMVKTGEGAGYLLSEQEHKRATYSEEERLKELEKVFDIRVPEAAPTAVEEVAIEATEAVEPREEPVPVSVEELTPEEEVGYYFNRAVSYQKRGNTLKAVEVYEKVLALDPNHAEAHNNRGVIYKEKGDLGKAAEHYRFVTSLNPGMDEAHNNLGVIYYLQGKTGAAELEYKRALEVNPENLASLINLGIVYKAQRRDRRAIEVFEHALSVDPFNPEAHYNLAILYEEQGHLELAIWYYTRFIENSGDSRPGLVEKVAGHVEYLKVASGEILGE